MEGIDAHCDYGTDRFNQLDSDIKEGGDDKDFIKVKSEFFNDIKDVKSDSKSDASNMISKLPCFGSGTLARPLVKFYFTSPCSHLGNLSRTI